MSACSGVFERGRSAVHSSRLGASKASIEGGGDLGDAIAARLRVTGHLPIEADDAPYVDNPAGVGNGVSYVGFALEGDYEVATGWFVGLVAEGGLFAIRRQTGGPVVSIYGAHAF